jgi:hypothetical protein
MVISDLNAKGNSGKTWQTGDFDTLNFPVAVVLEIADFVFAGYTKVTI